MTPEELKSARHALGLSAEGFARLIEGTDGAQVRKWESGSVKTTGPLRVLVRVLMNVPEAREYLGVEMKEPPPG